MPKTIHVALDLEYGLRLPDRELVGMLVENDRPLSPDEARGVLRKAWQMGYDVLPACDNHDERGRCRGCPVEE